MRSSIKSPFWLAIALLAGLMLTGVACASAAAPSGGGGSPDQTAAAPASDAASQQQQSGGGGSDGQASDAAPVSDVTPSQEEIGDTVDRTGWPEKVRLGLIPTESNVIVNWEPVIRHLEERLGLEVEPFVGTDYTATILAAKNNELDVVWLGPNSYVTARKQGAEIEPAVKQLNEDTGMPGYKSVLITHKDSGITSIEEARGRTFAFNDPESTSGYLVPTVFFLERTIDPEEYFSEVFFAGTHETTALAVANQKVDVASNNNENLPKLIEAGKVAEGDIVVLWESPLIPTDPISVQKSLPPSFHEAVKQAFLEFDDQAALDELQLGGWVPASDSDYDVIRQLQDTEEQLAAGN